jgi:hypothetical protein
VSINRTSSTFATNHDITAAEWTAEVTNLWTGLQAAYDPFTPTLTAVTTNPTLGTGSSVVGTFLRYGHRIEGQGDITFGTSGVVAGSGLYAVSLPVACTGAAVSSASVMGGGVFNDFSAGRDYVFKLIAVTTTTCRLVEASAGLFFTNASPVIPAINDRFNYDFNYQAA